MDRLFTLGAGGKNEPFDYDADTVQGLVFWQATRRRVL
jgi:hypothetical protein